VIAPRAASTTAIGLAIALAVGTAAAAPALTPAGYRAQLNRVCRSYTPKLKKLETAMAAAQKANNPRAFGVYLGLSLALVLEQDGRIERTPVPTAMRVEMAPILRQLKLADSHARLAVTDAVHGDSKGMIAELTKIAHLAPSLNRGLDHAGLRDCGSNQS
jgi:hypothetical protein